MANGYETNTGIESGIQPDARLLLWRDNYAQRTSRHDYYYDEFMVYGNTDGSTTYVDNILSIDLPPLEHPAGPDSAEKLSDEQLTDIHFDLESVISNLKSEGTDEDPFSALTVFESTGFALATHLQAPNDTYAQRLGIVTLTVPSNLRFNQAMDYLRTRTGFAPEVVDFDGALYSNEGLQQALTNPQLLASYWLGLRLHDMAVHNSVLPLLNEFMFETLASEASKNPKFIDAFDSGIGIELLPKIADLARARREGNEVAFTDQQTIIVHNMHKFLHFPPSKDAKLRVAIEDMVTRFEILAEMPKPEQPTAA